MLLDRAETEAGVDLLHRRVRQRGPGVQETLRRSMLRQLIEVGELQMCAQVVSAVLAQYQGVVLLRVRCIGSRQVDQGVSSRRTGQRVRHRDECEVVPVDSLLVRLQLLNRPGHSFAGHSTRRYVVIHRGVQIGVRLLMLRRTHPHPRSELVAVQRTRLEPQLVQPYFVIRQRYDEMILDMLDGKTKLRSKCGAGPRLGWNPELCLEDGPPELRRPRHRPLPQRRTDATSPMLRRYVDLDLDGVQVVIEPVLEQHRAEHPVVLERADRHPPLQRSRVAQGVPERLPPDHERGLAPRDHAGPEHVIPLVEQGQVGRVDLANDDHPADPTKRTGQTATE
jgi:hypothetical protein